MAAAGLVDRVLSSTIGPVDRGGRVAGPARCFSGHCNVAASVDRHLIYEADRSIRPGEIVVLGTNGFRTGAVVGGNTLAGWRHRGCAGVITDGLARDIDELAGLPTYTSGKTPLNSQGRWKYESLDRPVAMPGQSASTVVVHPGDILHADNDGAIVIPRANAAQVVNDAAVAERVEQDMRQQIEAGLDRGAVYLSHDRFGHIRPAT